MKKIILGILYWIWSLTWNGLMTIIGLFVSIFCIIFLHGKVHKNGYSYIVEIGGNWGGLNLGAISLCGGYTTTYKNLEWFEHTRKHEFGHSLQGLIFGPLFPFLIALPSVIRYHYQNYRESKGLPNAEYDAIWFEGTATKWGTAFMNKYERSSGNE